MNLRPRLARVATAVLPGRIAVDVGTDHAHLPIVLVQRHQVPRAWGLDRRAGPLATAGRSVARSGVTGRVKVQRSDGLDDAPAGAGGTLTIAGMGGASIVEILSRQPERAAAFARWVLQPQGAAGRVRAHIQQAGWHLVDEAYVQERGRIYAVLVAEPGPVAPWTPTELVLGPVALRRGDRLMSAWASAEKARLQADLQVAEACGDENGAEVLRSALQALRGGRDRARAPRPPGPVTC